GHRRPARRLVAVRRRAIRMMAEGERRHPRRSHGRRVHPQDATDNSAIRQHVEIVIVPFTGGTRNGSPLQDQRGHLVFSPAVCLSSLSRYVPWWSGGKNG